MVKISIGVNTADAAIVDKTNYLTMGAEITANLKAPCSTHTPTFIIAAADVSPAANYLHCSTWSTWYYINDIVYTAGGTAEISCSTDPLHTYRETIKNLTCHIVRQENIKNGYIRDTNIMASSAVHVENIIFDRQPFYEESQHGSSYKPFMLTVVGGYDNRTPETGG